MFNSRPGDMGTTGGCINQKVSVSKKSPVEFSIRDPTDDEKVV
jgi:hypothetical protein